jgi:hypothetical protein
MCTSAFSATNRSCSTSMWLTGVMVLCAGAMGASTVQRRNNVATSKQTSGQKTASAAVALGLSEPVEGEPVAEGAEVQALADFRKGLDGHDALQTMMDWCVERAQVTAEDQWSVMAAEVARILAGEDATSVLSESKPLRGKDFVGRPFRIDGFTLTETDYAEGWPFYANIHATIDRDGTTAVINCGGPKVIASLMRLDQLDAFPCFAMLQGKQTKAGYTVLDLVAPDAPRG